MKLIPDLEGGIFLKVPFSCLLHEINKEHITHMKKLSRMLGNSSLKINFII
jgi:hypothetical protein